MFKESNSETETTEAQNSTRSVGVESEERSQHENHLILNSGQEVSPNYVTSGTVSLSSANQRLPSDSEHSESSAHNIQSDGENAEVLAVQDTLANHTADHGYVSIEDGSNISANGCEITSTSTPSESIDTRSYSTAVTATASTNTGADTATASTNTVIDRVTASTNTVDENHAPDDICYV